MKYFINRRGQWQFHGWQKSMNMNMNMDCQFNLFQIAKVPIERHVKIRSEATLFDLIPRILGKRKAKRQCRNSWNEPNLAAL